MNRTSISWLHRAAWGAVVLLLGLLLSSCESAGPEGTREEGAGGSEVPGLKTLDIECLEVDTTGVITNFYKTKADCALTKFAIPSEKDDIPITAIGVDAFSNKGLTSVRISAGVTSIKGYAFQNNNLTSVTIPNSVKTIGGSAFENNDLTGVTIPDRVISIGASAFENNDLTGVTIPDRVISIGARAFLNNKLTSLTLGNSVRTIGAIAFENNDLTGLTIPDSVEIISAGAFTNNPNLKTIVIEGIPHPNRTIALNAFMNGASIANQDPRETGTWTFEGEPPAWAFSSLLEDCLSVDATGTITDFYDTKAGCELKELAIPGKVPATDATADPITITRIGVDVFKSKALTKLSIPNSVTEIGENAFADNQLTSVRIPDDVTTIGASAFAGNHFAYVTIPDSVTTIGEMAFADNRNLKTVILDPHLNLMFYASSFPNDLWTPFDDQDPKEAGTWILIGNPPAWTFGVLPAYCLSVDNGTITAFDNRKEDCAFTKFAIPSEKDGIPITAIGEYAFTGKKLTSVIIPAGVTSIGTSAFFDNELTSVTIPNSVRTIGRGAFTFNRLTEITIPNSVTSIGGAAFSTNRLTEITIPNSVTSIGEYAFATNQLTELTISNSVTTIGEGTFANNQLESVIIPAHITSIGARSFFDNELTSVSIPNSVTSIGEMAFADSSNLKTVILNPNAGLSFDASSFPNDLWTAFDDQDPKEAGTWTRSGSTWSFSN